MIQVWLKCNLKGQRHKMFTVFIASTKEIRRHLALDPNSASKGESCSTLVCREVFDLIFSNLLTNCNLFSLTAWRLYLGWYFKISKLLEQHYFLCFIVHFLTAIFVLGRYQFDLVGSLNGTNLTIFEEMETFSRIYQKRSPCSSSDISGLCISLKIVRVRCVIG